MIFVIVLLCYVQSEVEKIFMFKSSLREVRLSHQNDCSLLGYIKFSKNSEPCSHWHMAR